MVQTRRRKRGKVYLHEINRKRLWVKEKRKREVRVRHCPLIRSNWEANLSVPTNYREFAIVHDVKKAFPIPTTKELINPEILQKNLKRRRKQKAQSDNDEDEDDDDVNPSFLPAPDLMTSKKKRRPTKVHIRDEIEQDATAERVKSLRIADPERLYVIEMTSYSSLSFD